MCDFTKPGGMLNSIAAFFSEPTFRKGTPAYAVSGCNVFNISVPGMVATITLIYTIVLLIGAIPGVWKTWDFFKARCHHKDEGDKENK